MWTWKTSAQYFMRWKLELASHLFVSRRPSEAKPGCLALAGDRLAAVQMLFLRSWECWCVPVKTWILTLPPARSLGLFSRPSKITETEETHPMGGRRPNFCLSTLQSYLFVCYFLPPCAIFIKPALGFARFFCDRFWRWTAQENKYQSVGCGLADHSRIHTVEYSTAREQLLPKTPKRVSACSYRSVPSLKRLCVSL